MNNSSSNSAAASSSSSSSSDSSVENNAMMQKVLNVFSGVLDSVPSDQQMRMEFLIQFSKLQELVVRSRNCMDVQTTRVNQLYEVIKSQREKINIHEDVMKKIEINQNDVIDTSNALNKFSQNLSIEFSKLKELYELQMNKINDLNKKVEMLFLKLGDFEVRYSNLEYCFKNQEAQIQLLLPLLNNNNSHSRPIQEEHKSSDMNIERSETHSLVACMNIPNHHTFQELKKLNNSNWMNEIIQPLTVSQKKPVTLDVAFNSSKYFIQSTKVQSKLRNNGSDNDENNFLFNNNVDTENSNKSTTLNGSAIDQILNTNFNEDDDVQCIDMNMNIKKIKSDNIPDYSKLEHIDTPIQSPLIQHHHQSSIEGEETSIPNDKQTTFNNPNLINNPVNDSNLTNLFQGNSIQQLQDLVTNQTNFSNKYLQEQEQHITDTNNDSFNTIKDSKDQVPQGEEENEEEVTVVDDENKSKQNSRSKNTLNKNQKTKQPDNQRKQPEKKDFTRVRRTQEQLLNMQATTYASLIDNANKK